MWKVSIASTFWTEIREKRVTGKTDSKSDGIESSPYNYTGGNIKQPLWGNAGTLHIPIQEVPWAAAAISKRSAVLGNIPLAACHR